MIHATCHTADNVRCIEFDATPWFSEADAPSIIDLAQRGWTSTAIAESLEHRRGYEGLHNLVEYAAKVPRPTCDIGRRACAQSSRGRPGSKEFHGFRDARQIGLHGSLQVIDLPAAPALHRLRIKPPDSDQHVDGTHKVPGGMPTKNIVLTKRQEELKSGRYQNASEVLREGLRLVEQRAAEDASRLKVLRAAARVGIDALERGEFKEFETAGDLHACLNDLSEKVISRTSE